MLLTPFLWIFVNLIKKSLTIRLWQDTQKHFGELRRPPRPLRYQGASGHYDGG